MKSERDEERIFAARSLGTLGCTSSEEVVLFLAENLAKETSVPCKYEIAKSIVCLGKCTQIPVVFVESYFRNHYFFYTFFFIVFLS